MSHITIARIKQVYNKKEFVKYLGSIKYEKMDFKIEEFFLMESELTAEGPVYKKIKKYKYITESHKRVTRLIKIRDLIDEEIQSHLHKLNK